MTPKDLFRKDVFYHSFNGERARPELIVVMHGFPGRNKHLDLAQALYERSPCDVVVPHNIGIGKTETHGEFSFYQSVTRPLDFMLQWQESDYQRIHLVGLSWGGLVVLNAFLRMDERRRGVLGLLCPLSHFHELESEKEKVKALMEEVPELFTRLSLDEAWNDLLKVRDEFSPENQLEKTPLERVRVEILHGRQDEVIPVEDSRRLCEKLGSGAHLKEVDDDHQFNGDRPNMIDIVTDWFTNESKIEKG